MDPSRSLDEQRREFASRRFLAMPLAGTIAWLVVAGGSMLLPRYRHLVLFAATGAIAYLGTTLSKVTGEDFLDKTRPKNAFDSLFFHTVAMSLLAYGIAIPFFLVDPSSLPLSVGIISGLMWLPVSWVHRALDRLLPRLRTHAPARRRALPVPGAALPRDPTGDHLCVRGDNRRAGTALASVELGSGYPGATWLPIRRPLAPFGASDSPIVVDHGSSLSFRGRRVPSEMTEPRAKYGWQSDFPNSDRRIRAPFASDFSRSYETPRRSRSAHGRTPSLPCSTRLGQYSCGISSRRSTRPFSSTNSRWNLGVPT